MGISRRPARLERRRNNSIWILLASTISGCSAIPAVAFPFNSQVPTVARVGESYSFQLSSSTFIPEDSNFTYSLSDQPSWLGIDSATRTLTGAPSSADVGASSFTLTAADDTGAAHMPCVLVVSSDPPPQIDWSISKQLAATANLSSSQPPVVTILPSTAFQFDFRQDSFIDIVQRKLTYYATLTDHTPLPAWLIFNAQSLSFSGIAPQLSAFPQSWNIDLIASDVEGFAGAAASYTLGVGTQQLVFVPEYQQINISAGMRLEFDGLSDALYLNGKQVAANTLSQARASVPSWLEFDSTTLALSGTVPSSASNQNITVTAVDAAGNTATAIVGLVNGTASLFTSTVPNLVAYFGQAFSYRFPNSLFSDPDVELLVVLPMNAAWLKFDAATHVLSGTAPSVTSPLDVEATLIARISEGAAGQSRAFNIKVESRSSIRPSPPSTSEVQATTTNTVRPRPSDFIVAGKRHHLGTAAAAGIIAGTIVGATVVAILLICCWRKRRHTESYVEDIKPEKRTISRPILPPDVTAIAVTTEWQTDVENLADGSRFGTIRAVEPAPQIAIDLPAEPSTRRMKSSKRFSRISHASSIGNGEDAILADGNIPILGRQSVTLHTPHDSFSVPTEMARSSRRPSELSPSKRALQKLQNRRQSTQSIGLGIDTGGANLLPRHSTRNASMRKRDRRSVGQSTLLDCSSIASQSTRGTSMLSTRPSDFPRPPTRSTMAGSQSIPTPALTDAQKRQSIRMVPHSDGTGDNRSLQDKRQSFIKKRASTSLASPLFAHGSRAPTDPRQNSHTSVTGSAASSKRRSRRRRSQLTSSSESSSLEPPPRDPRRLSARVRSAFAPNFPRAVTKSTLGADDEGYTEYGDASSEYCSTASSITEGDLAAEMALPRHKRSWVLPGEASPTPPPAPPTSRQPSSGRGSQPAAGSRPRQKWKDRLRARSSSPLATAVAVPLGERSPNLAGIKKGSKRRSSLSEPMSLVSNDSLNRGKLERPRLVHTNSKRPVSVEKVQRLSSLHAETEDSRPGSEMWEAMEGAGLMPPTPGESRVGTQRSNMSGSAFL